jgi:hypothetical protein
MERGDDRARFGDRLLEMSGHRLPAFALPLGGVLTDRDQALHRCVMERLGKSPTLALLDREELGEQSLPVRGEPSHLGGSFVGHVPA